MKEEMERRERKSLPSLGKEMSWRASTPANPSYIYDYPSWNCDMPRPRAKTKPQKIKMKPNTVRRYWQGGKLSPLNRS